MTNETVSDLSYADTLWKTAEASTLFFQTVQNKVHWAAHRQTAAEVIASRAAAGKPHMGLTS